MKEYAKSFYQSDAWKKARQTAIKRANGLCERCRAAGRFVPGVIVHHKKYITPGNIHDARVTLALDNLELVCEDCHNKEHKAKHITRYRFDGNGNLLPPTGEKERVTKKVALSIDWLRMPSLMEIIMAMKLITLMAISRTIL